jgi:hypothetical protein
MIELLRNENGQVDKCFLDRPYSIEKIDFGSLGYDIRKAKMGVI